MKTVEEWKNLLREGGLVTNGDAWTLAERVYAASPQGASQEAAAEPVNIDRETVLRCIEKVRNFLAFQCAGNPPRFEMAALATICEAMCAAPQAPQPSQAEKPAIAAEPGELSDDEIEEIGEDCGDFWSVRFARAAIAASAIKQPSQEANDAARYRYLCEHDESTDEDFSEAIAGILDLYGFDRFRGIDEAIDAAIDRASTQPGEHGGTAG